MLRRLQRELERKLPFVFTSERGSPFTMAGFARMVERAGVEAKLGSKAIPYAAARRRLRPGRRRSSSPDQKKLHDLHRGSSSRSSFFAGRSVMSLINAWQKMESRLTADRWLARRSPRWPELAALRACNARNVRHRP
jgi:hypothetical protein